MAIGSGAGGEIHRGWLVAGGNPDADQASTVGYLDGVPFMGRKFLGEFTDGQNCRTHVRQNTSDKKIVNFMP